MGPVEKLGAKLQILFLMVIKQRLAGLIMIAGIGLVLVRENPIVAWVGLELNMLAFLPFLAMTPPASLMYLLAQLVGRLFLVMGFSLGS